MLLSLLVMKIKVMSTSLLLKSYRPMHLNLNQQITIHVHSMRKEYELDFFLYLFSDTVSRELL